MKKAIEMVPPPLKVSDVPVCLSPKSVRGPCTFDPDAACAICSKVLWAPQLCSKCPLMYCTDCINSALPNNQQKCPSCDRDYKECKVPKMILNYLEKLTFACDKCPAEVKYCDVAKHKFEHVKDYVICPLKCGQPDILHREMEAHFQTSCSAIETQCVRCDTVVVRGQQKNHDCTRVTTDKIDRKAAEAEDKFKMLQDENAQMKAESER